MAFMEWNDRLTTGIAAIDGDHRKLLAMINALYDAIGAGAGREAVGAILEGLVDYTRFHFGREESFFTRTQYPGREQHTQEHDRMVAWVQDVQARFAEGTAVAPSLEVMTYLKDWLFDHILGSDQRYAQHLTANGVG